MLRSLVGRSDSTHPERMLTDIWPEAVISDLVRLCEEWQPAVVVHDEGEYAAVLACCAARPALRDPLVRHARAVAVRAGRGGQPADPALARARRARRPSEEPRTTGALYLDACPPPFQLGGLRGIPSVRPVRGILYDGPGGRRPVWLAGLERPAAYVTLGADPAYSSAELLGPARPGDARASCARSS